MDNFCYDHFIYNINSYKKILKNSIRFYKLRKMRTDPILISTIFNDQLEKLVYKKPIVKPLTAKTTKSLVNCKRRILNKVLLKTFKLLNVKNHLDINQIFAKKAYKKNKWFIKEKRKITKKKRVCKKRLSIKVS